MKKQRVLTGRSAIRYTLRSATSKIKIIMRRNGQVDVWSTVYQDHQNRTCMGSVTSTHARLHISQLKQVIEPLAQVSLISPVNTGGRVARHEIIISHQIQLVVFLHPHGHYHLAYLHVGPAFVRLTKAGIRQMMVQLDRFAD